MTNKRQDENGSALILVLLLTVLLFALGVALLGMSDTENLIAANDQWSEGAFQAAEGAVQVAVDQLSREAGADDLVVAVTELGDRYTYRSGERDDTEPQPPEFVGTTTSPGFAVSQSTGYNSSGYVFEIYQINGTGNGPRNTTREVEVQVELGPVAQ